jgi:pyrimidine operon attenuation protein/uracil phosphoribosyltransferase
MVSIVLMTAAALRLSISRMAYEIAERHAGTERLVLLGIQKGGAHFGTRLANELTALLSRPVPSGQLDTALHRDDHHQRPAPVIHPTNIPGDLTGATVILADDVLFSGRTVRAALDALHDFGRPTQVQLAVLINRVGHRQLPIQADYVARGLETRADDRVDVRWSEDGGDDRVYLHSP